MSLEELVDNRYTDKTTVHSYLPLYQHLLEPLKDSTRNVLEIGQGSWGASALMFSKFFTKIILFFIILQMRMRKILLINSLLKKD